MVSYTCQLLYELIKLGEQVCGLPLLQERNYLFISKLQQNVLISCRNKYHSLI